MSLLSDRRKGSQSMRYRSWFAFCLLLIVIIFIFYSFYIDEYFIIFPLLQIPTTVFLSSHTNLHSLSDLLTIANNSEYSQPLFQSRLSPHYPRLPIHIYTQNLTSLKGPAKLILLGNGFFGDKIWGFSAIGKSPTELMTQLACPYLANYCDITADQSFFSDADAVVYHMRDDIDQKHARKHRHPEQRFVFAIWESPVHTPKLKRYKAFFNWTMTYRFKSHIIAPFYYANAYIHTSSDYFRMRMEESVIKNRSLIFSRPDHRPSDEVLANKKLGTVAALISNCGGSSQRLDLIYRLRRFIDVKVYGRCGEKCPPKVDCRRFIAKNYYFLLSFENSLCKDYTTEKFFSTLEHPIVPVVLGGTNYSHLIPPTGFIDTSDFSTLISLARYLNHTRYNKEKYLSYFSWKQDYVWGMSSWFMSFCDLCLRLHLDSTPNVIEDMDAWWNDDACHGPRKFQS